MGVYDFNIPRYNIDGVIDALRKELQSIVINSQTSIDEIKQRIADDEVILNRLKDAVNNLPDYSAQYNELYEEMARIKIALQDLIDHPIVLEDIQVGLTTEVQKINGQYLYANHAVSAINDFSGRNIVDTYATKDELSGYISGAFNEISAVSSELTNIIVNFSADTNDKFNNIENILTEKTDYLSGAIDSISGIVDTELDNLAYKIDTVSGELKSDIEAVDNKIDNVSAELEDSIDTVDNKIDAVSAVVDEKYEEISATIDSVSAWANETFLTDADLNDYALSADVDSRLEDTSAWANDTFVTSVNLEDDKQYVMTNSGWQEIPKNTDIIADEYNPAAPPQTYGTDPGLEHYCIYDLKLYRCKEVCIGENDPWNPNYWEETTISEELYKNNMMNDNDIDNILNELD